MSKEPKTQPQHSSCLCIQHTHGASGEQGRRVVRSFPFGKQGMGLGILQVTVLSLTPRIGCEHTSHQHQSFWLGAVRSSHVCGLSSTRSRTVSGREDCDQPAHPSCAAPRPHSHTEDSVKEELLIESAMNSKESQSHSNGCLCYLGAFLGLFCQAGCWRAALMKERMLRLVGPLDRPVPT